MNSLINFKSIAIVVFIGVVVAAALFPVHSEDKVFETSLLITPVLFAIFTAFSISERLSRVDKIRENDSIERSSLEMLNSFIESNSLENYKNLNKLIDEYLMATLDYSIWDYYKTRAYYEKISIYLYSIKDNKVNYFCTDLLLKILEAREQTTTLISDRLSGLEWLIYFVLGAGVLTPFIMMNIGTFLNIIMIALITVSVLLLLLLLYKLDNLEWKKEVRIFKPYQKTFEAIGSMNYFPEGLMDYKKIENITDGSYRVGHFPYPYPNMEGKSVKIHNKQ